MAEDKDDLELDVKESDGGGGNNNTKLIIIMAGVSVLVSILAVVITVMLVGGGNEVKEEAGAEEVVVQVNSKEAFYYDVRPPFVINYHTKGRIRYLQVHVELMVRGEEALQYVQQHLPLIKNNLVTLFTSADFSTIQNYEGKEKLREQALEEVQRVLVDQTGEPQVEAVLFTSFVIQ